MPILLLWDLSSLCVVDHSWPSLSRSLSLFLSIYIYISLYISFSICIYIYIYIYVYVSIYVCVCLCVSSHGDEKVIIPFYNEQYLIESECIIFYRKSFLW